ncbi:hypothetical protein DFH09DRAFT_1193162, partial [Mycena vulgaris]
NVYSTSCAVAFMLSASAVLRRPTSAHPASSSPQYGSHFNPGGRRGTCPWDILLSAATHGAQLILWRLLYLIPARFIERRRVSPWV